MQPGKKGTGFWIDSMTEMGNRVLWVKLNLSYTAQGIVNVWVLAIRHRQNQGASTQALGEMRPHGGGAHLWLCVTM